MAITVDSQSRFMLHDADMQHAHAGKRITAANTRARAFVAALPPKHAKTAAASLASRHAATALRIPGLGKEAADYIKRPFNLGGEPCRLLS